MMSDPTNRLARRIPVDFGNCGADGAVRLVTRGATEAIEAAQIRLQEGLEVLLTDDELNATARVTMRDGMWVAVIANWLADTESPR